MLLAPPNIFVSSPPRRDGSGLAFVSHPIFGGNGMVLPGLTGEFPDHTVLDVPLGQSAIACCIPKGKNGTCTWSFISDNIWQHSCSWDTGGCSERIVAPTISDALSSTCGGRNSWYTEADMGTSDQEDSGQEESCKLPTLHYDWASHSVAIYRPSVAPHRANHQPYVIKEPIFQFLSCAEKCILMNLQVLQLDYQALQAASLVGMCKAGWAIADIVNAWNAVGEADAILAKWDSLIDPGDVLLRLSPANQKAVDDAIWEQWKKWNEALDNQIEDFWKWATDSDLKGLLTDFSCECIDKYLRKFVKEALDAARTVKDISRQYCESGCVLSHLPPAMPPAGWP